MFGVTGCDAAPALEVREGVFDQMAHFIEIFIIVALLFSVLFREKLEITLRNMKGSKIEIVKRPDDAKGFLVIARRWVVERSFARLGRCQRLAKDWEATIASSEAWLLGASIRRITTLIARV